MEMAIDREDFDFEVIEDDNIILAKKQNVCVLVAALRWQADLIKSSALLTVGRDILNQKETLTAAQRSVEKTRSFLIEHLD